MATIISNGSLSTTSTSKAMLAAALSYVNNASTLVAANESTTSILHYVVEHYSTGLIRVGISRLVVGDAKSWAILGTSILASYVLLCSALRFRRRDAMAKKYGYISRQSMANMTTTEAQEIMKYMAGLEFPKIFMSSIEFALFKTYGIPTISGLLNSTREFSNPKSSPKRLADTSILIGEFVSHPPDSERSIKAISRMNYIHSGYQTSGKISHDDLLYTLSVFMTEPVRWIERYEWRTMTPMECCAIGTFWKGMADSMAIEYQTRLSLGKSGWKDGIEFYEDVSIWARLYEKKYMVPAVSNKQTADETVNLLLHFVPLKFRPYATKVITVLMEDRLRKSMMYAELAKSYTFVVNKILQARRFVLRYLSLPRPGFLIADNFNDKPDPATGRYYYNFYKVHPYYNKPGFWNRWGPVAWAVWFVGGDVPGDKGDLYVPQGYVFEEVGPKRMVGKGKEFTDAWEKKLTAERTPGCPFRR